MMSTQKDSSPGLAARTVYPSGSSKEGNESKPSKRITSWGENRSLFPITFILSNKSDNNYMKAHHLAEGLQDFQFVRIDACQMVGSSVAAVFFQKLGKGYFRFKPTVY
jgi:hypothetical protein